MTTLPLLNAARRVTAPHIVVFVVLHLGISAALYWSAVPNIAQSLALTQLKPEDARVERFGGVYATATPDGTNFRGQDVRRSYINGEYIADFTNAERTADVHGYTKAANDWLIQSPKIGEEPIYLRQAALAPLALALGFAGACLLTLLLPANIGLLALLTEREIEQTRIRLALESGVDADTLDVLTMPDHDLKRVAESQPDRVQVALRKAWSMVEQNVVADTPLAEEFTTIPHGYVVQCREYLLQRVRQYMPVSVFRSLMHVAEARSWQQHRFRILSALRLYMSEYFVPRYASRVTGLVYGGSAFLIMLIGLRGLRFLSPSRPSFLVAMITVEFALLLLMGITHFYSHDEAGSESSLKNIETDMHKLATVVDAGNTAAVERAVHQAVADYVTAPGVVEEHFTKVISERITAALRK
jgi:hypothetical protein